MLKKGKRIWALLLAVGLLAAQLPAAAQAAPETKAASHYKTQTDSSSYVIDEDEMGNLINQAVNTGRGDVLAAGEGSAMVEAQAWALLEGRRFIARTLSKGAVQVQLAFSQPTPLARDLWVSGWIDGPEVRRVRELLDRQFENVEMVIHLDQGDDWGQPVEIAARPPAGYKADNVGALTFYSYNADSNTYRRIPAPEPWIDGAGWLRFTTPYAGDMIISRGQLEKRKIRLSLSSGGSSGSRSGGGSRGGAASPIPNVKVTATNDIDEIRVKSVEPLANGKGLRVTLSAPTEPPLEMSNFTISKKDRQIQELDRVVTADNQVYELYTKDPMPNGIYNIQIRLPDGTTLDGNGDIQINQIRVESVGLLPSRKELQVSLSAPTDKPLGKEDFSVTQIDGTPSSVECVETTDNQIYNLVLGVMIYDGTYRLGVELPDGTTLSKEWDVDIDIPSLTAMTIVRQKNGTVDISFNMSKAGIVYYGTCVSENDCPSNADTVVANGQKKNVDAGTNNLTLVDIPPNHEYFYCVTANKHGRYGPYMDKKEISSNAVTVLEPPADMSAGLSQVPPEDQTQELTQVSEDLRQPENSDADKEEVPE